MIKKVLKKYRIPKYENGTPAVDEQSDEQSWVQRNLGLKKGAAGAGQIAGAVGGASLGIASALGIELGKTGQIISGVGQIASNFGPIGQIVGGALQTVGAFTGGGGAVDENTGDVTKSSGLTRWLGFGRSDKSLFLKSNRIKNSLLAKEQTADLQAEWMNNNPNVEMQPAVLAAEGGIMRRPVDALVSKGELIYDPTTKELRKIPGDKGKTNKKDDVPVKLYEGDIVLSNSPTMLMSNGLPPAKNLEMLVDKKDKVSEGTKKAREAIIKKVVNWQEANKTKPQLYAMYAEGDIVKYGYDKNLDNFAYWDKNKKEYKKEYLDFVNSLTDQDVKDIFSGKYGDMSTYKSVNKDYVPTLDEAKQLMTDKKYGNWHKIGKAVVDKKIIDKKQEPISPQPIKMKVTGTTMYQDTHPGNYPIDYEVSPVTMDLKLKKVANPSLADAAKRVRQKERKQLFKDFLSNTGDIVSDSIPMLGAMFGNYDYHTERPQISPYRYIPTGVSIEPIRRAANESYAMARYNQTNINPNTGAGMAYGLQAASNRAKTLADAYTWQQDAQNKLIAQNAGIYNDWAKRYDAARYQAIADTRANEGAAQQMKDSAIRDALEFTQGRRNDKMRLAMMEPLAKYAFDDDTYKKIYSRAIA